MHTPAESLWTQVSTVLTGTWQRMIGLNSRRERRKNGETPVRGRINFKVVKMLVFLV
jgi:hypothetical protein